MTSDEVRDLIHRCLPHIVRVQASLRSTRNDRPPGPQRQEVCQALLWLTDAENFLLRALLVSDDVPNGWQPDGWADLLSRVPSCCAGARKWIGVGCLLEQRGLEANLDVVIEFLQGFGSADTETGLPAPRAKPGPVAAKLTANPVWQGVVRRVIQDNGVLWPITERESGDLSSRDNVIYNVEGAASYALERMGFGNVAEDQILAYVFELLVGPEGCYEGVVDYLREREWGCALPNPVQLTQIISKGQADG